MSSNWSLRQNATTKCCYIYNQSIVAWNFSLVETKLTDHCLIWGLNEQIGVCKSHLRDFLTCQGKVSFFNCTKFLIVSLLGPVVERFNTKPCLQNSFIQIFVQRSDKTWMDDDAQWNTLLLLQLLLLLLLLMLLLVTPWSRLPFWKAMNLFYFGSIKRTASWNDSCFISIAQTYCSSWI